MSTFVSLDEYVDYFGIDASALTRAIVDLDAACDTIRDYLCQQIDVVTNDVITLFGTDTRAMLLPELPVTAVTSITLDGDPVTDWTVDDYGVLWRTDPAYWPRGTQYTVTYSHGYAEVPAILKVVAFQLARASSTSTPGVKQESIAGYSVTYADAATGTDDGLLSALDRRVVKRVPVP